MKKLLIILIICLSIGLKNVSANTIKNIVMDVYIDEFGNASVTETWQAKLDSGTEGYRTFSKNANYTISDLEVTDNSGTIYSNIDSWNNLNTFAEKAYKSGIRETYDKIELCFGISEYGEKSYTLKYKINNLVNRYTDKEGIYFNFLNFDDFIYNAKVIIHSYTDLSLDNSRIWAFGYSGDITFQNGSIILDSKGMLASSEYMVGLIGFEKELYNTDNKVNKSFQSIYDDIMEEVNPSEDDIDNDKEKVEKLNIPIWLKIILLPLAFLMSPLFLLIGAVVLFIFIFVITRNIKENPILDFGEAGINLPDIKEVNYWRDIPCDKNILYAYFASKHYKITNNETLQEGIIGALFLKWVKEDKIIIRATKSGLFNFRDNDYAVEFNSDFSDTLEYEHNLYLLLKEAAGINNVLEIKEFEKWCHKNYVKLFNWFNLLEIEAEKYLETKGLITISSKTIKESFTKKKTYIYKNVSPKVKEEAIKLLGLKRFLLDFSLIYEKEFIEVNLWDEYLIYAELIGIADKVEEQFEKLYPDFNKNSKLNNNNSLIFLRNFAHIGYTTIIEEKKKVNENNTERRTRDSEKRDKGYGGDSYKNGGNDAGGSTGGGFR